MDNKKTSLWEIIEEFDEEFKFSDFTPDELEEYLDGMLKTNEDFKNKYFSFYNDVKSPSLKKQDW